MSNPTRNTQKPKKSGDSHTGRKRPKSARNQARSDRLRPHDGKAKGGRKNSAKGGAPDSAAKLGWIWGTHAVMAALGNPNRKLHELRISPKAAERLAAALGDTPELTALRKTSAVTFKEVHPSELDALLPEGTAHQGIALRASPARDSDIPSLAEPCEGLILVLDQVTDPHNVGAMFRLAAAFGARGIIMQDRNAPPLAGATAKVAVGTIEAVPHALVTNIGNTLNELKDRGWMVTGLAGEASLTLQQAFVLPKNASMKANVVVMGAEGPGLRPRVRDCCDQLAKIPMPGGAESLNVSTAAAIALYEAVRD